MALQPADHESLLGALHELSTATDGFGTAAARIIRRLVPCEVLTYNVIDLATGATTAAFDPPTWEPIIEAKREVWDRWSAQNPILAHCLATGDSRPLRYGDVDGGDRVTETELFAAFYEPLGLRHQLAMVLPAPSDLVIAIALNRAPGPDFSERDVEVLARLRPHLLFHHRGALAARLLADGAAAGAHVMLLGDGGRVESLSHLDPTGTFVVGRPAPRTVLDSLGEAPTTALVGDPVTRRVDEHVWTLRLARASDGPTVLVATRAATGPPAARLTGREREVAVALAHGGTNAQLAARLGMRSGTLKKHLERIYRKLGVNDRASAIAKVQREPPDRT